MRKKLSISVKPILFLIVVSFASAIFEIGNDYFIKKIGISLFVASTLLLLTSYFFILSLRMKVCLNKPFFLLIVVLMLYSFLTLYWSPTFYQGLLSLIKTLWYFVWLVLGSNLLIIFRFEDGNKAFKNSLVLALLLLFIIPVVNSFYTGINKIIIFRDYNIYIQCLILTVTGLFGIFNQENLRSKKFIIYILICIIVFVVGLISGSRRSTVIYIPIMIISPILLATLRKKIGKIVIPIFILSFLVILSTQFFYSLFYKNNIDISNNVMSRIDRSVGFITGNYADNNRVSRWRNGFDLYIEGTALEIIFGRGQRSYLSDNRFIRADGSPDSPHNYLISGLIEGGIVELLILFFITGYFIWYNFFVILQNKFWIANFAFVNSFIWLISVSISAQGFFDNRIIFFYLLFISFYKNKNNEVIKRIKE